MASLTDATSAAGSRNPGPATAGRVTITTGA